MSYVYQSITPGNWSSGRAYRANSDGFVQGTVSYPGDSSKGCNCMAYGYCNGVYAMVTGGNTGFFGKSWADCMWSNPNSLLLPVYSGATFYAGIAQASGTHQQVDAPFSFYWIGPQAASRSAFEEVDVSSDPNFRPPPLPMPGESDDNGRETLIAVLERAIGKPLDAQSREQILSLRL